MAKQIGVGIYRRYNLQPAGGVVPNAHPNVYVYPWVPTQNAVRPDPNPAVSVGTKGNSNAATSGRKNDGTRIQRIQPHEKNSFFSPRGYSFAASSPNRDACGCGGQKGNTQGHAPGERG